MRKFKGYAVAAIASVIMFAVTYKVASYCIRVAALVEKRLQ